MTAAVVAPLPLLPPPPMDVNNNVSVCGTADPAEARKRRREILASQRTIVHLQQQPELVVSTTTTTTTATATASSSSSSGTNTMTSSIALPVAKKRKVSTGDASVETTTKPPKKPQMKYDPDVPMTKEEAAVWRREQRRKRNRESAAASRQRQRDRIHELEGEVDEWKNKYESIMAKVRHLEQLTGNGDQDVTEDEPPQQQQPTRTETPPPVQTTVTPRASPTSTTDSLVSLTDSSKVKDPQQQVVRVTKVDGEQQKQQEEQEPIKMISRPAVKITSSSTSFCPLLPEQPQDVATTTTSRVVPPEPVLSSEDTTTTSVPSAAAAVLEPIDSTLFPCPVLHAPEDILSSSHHDDPEFGEFLLDAVDWL